MLSLAHRILEILSQEQPLVVMFEMFQIDLSDHISPFNYCNLKGFVNHSE